MGSSCSLHVACVCVLGPAYYTVLYSFLLAPCTHSPSAHIYILCIDFLLPKSYLQVAAAPARPLLDTARLLSQPSVTSPPVQGKQHTGAPASAKQQTQRERIHKRDTTHAHAQDDAQQRASTRARAAGHGHGQLQVQPQAAVAGAVDETMREVHAADAAVTIGAADGSDWPGQAGGADISPAYATQGATPGTRMISQQRGPDAPSPTAGKEAADEARDVAAAGKRGVGRQVELRSDHRPWLLRCCMCTIFNRGICPAQSNNSCTCT